MIPPAKQPQKRFYKTVTTVADGDGFRVELDGKSIKTPARAVLILPTPSLAAAVADEWNSQGEHLQWRTLGLTKLANTAIDAVALKRGEVLDDILKYAGSDLICYRAENPSYLAAKQAEVWDPILAWVRGTCGVEFKTVTGITPVEQPETSIDRLRLSLMEYLAGAIVDPRLPGDDSEQGAASQLDPFKLAALHVMTTITGSALLAFAHVAKKLTLESLWTAAMVDEDWQSKQWGKDFEAEIRNENRLRDLETASRLFDLASARA